MYICICMHTPTPAAPIIYTYMHTYAYTYTTELIKEAALRQMATLSSGVTAPAPVQQLQQQPAFQASISCVCVYVCVYV